MNYIKSISLIILLSACSSNPAISTPTTNSSNAASATDTLSLVTSWSSSKERRARDGERKFAMSAFIDDRYEYLETLASLYGLEKHHYTSSGFSKRRLLYLGILDAWHPPKFDKDSYYERMVAKALKWTISHPEKPVAHFTYVYSLLEYAWAYRGHGYSNSVSEEDMDSFHEYSKMAMDYLIKHREKLDSDIRWYILSLDIGRNIGLDFSVINKLVEEAENKFYDPHQIHNMAVIYLLPKWYGSIEELDHFIQRSSSRNKARTADENYALLYAYAAGKNFKRKLFHDTHVDWKRMRKGFKIINSKYPTKWNKNRFAYYACIAGDKPTTKHLLAKIGSKPIRQLWFPKAKETFNACVKWAMEPDDLPIEFMASINKL